MKYLQDIDTNQEDLVTVYRVEDSDGDGAYRGKDYFDRFKNMSNHYLSPKRRSWTEDFEWQQQARMTTDYRSGFDSMKSLFAWFGGLIPVFYKTSTLRIVKYKVPAKNVEHSISGKQIAFIKPKPNENHNSNSTDIIDDISF